MFLEKADLLRQIYVMDGTENLAFRVYRQSAKIYIFSHYLCLQQIKRISRSFSSDGWTRKLHLSIPVIEYSHWNSVRTSLEKMLSFLSGDIWTIDFRECEPTNRYQDNHKRPPQKLVSLEEYDAVSLLSGGLDSYCGAYELLSQGKNVIFVGFKEFGKLEQIQNEIVHHFNESFPQTSKMLFTFTAKSI